jgi:4-hydroxy-2-oxoheptanedioate aldolase
MLTELAVWAGFDFVIVDCEHGVVDEQAHLASLQVLTGSSAFAIVRVRAGDLGAVSRYLDLGAPAIMMPNVQSAAEAKGFVAAANFAPAGTRSSTGNAMRGARYGLGAPLSSDAPLLFAMVEGRRALAQITAIVATPGLAGIVIGPYDLSADLGCQNNFEASAYTEAFAAIESAALQAGLILGTSAHPGFPLRRLLDAGHRLLITSVDVLALRDGLRAQLAAAREVGHDSGANG